MAIREVDAIENAIIETEREIAGEAWGQEDTELDETGDRSAESMGEGLEGQHEPEDEDAEGEEAEGEESEGEGESETAEVVAAKAAEAAAKGKTGEGEQPKPGEQPGGRVPSGEYRKVAERARAAEAERDVLKAQIEKAGGDTKSLTDRLDLVMREIADLKRAPRAEPKAVEPPKPASRPDIFENPDAVFDYMDKGVQTAVAPLLNEIKNLRVENSMAIAHASHKDTFEKAFESINKLNPQNPDDRATVQRIYSSPNPGEALVAWHKNQQTLAEVGPDPAAYREKVAKETREALMKDPEFRKAIVAELRGEASQGEAGQPRTVTRLPNSLHRAAGSNVGANRAEPGANDDSDQAVADSAWR